MPFVETKDIQELEKHGINFKEDYPIFLEELYNYLEDTWQTEYHQDLEPLKNGDIDGFNIKLNYPSWSGYYILDDSFTGPCENLDKLMSQKSKELFGYFYGFHLR